MNCSYRIAKNVHIGLRVRKTKDKNTVSFANEPVKEVQIISASKDGYHLKHKGFPKAVFLDHEQLDITDLHIKRGVIQDEITFVEAINGRSKTNMVMIRTNTFDYLELMEDKKIKDESPKCKIKDLEIGERCISAICRDSNVMIYLGTFFGATFEVPYHYNYYNNNKIKQYGYIDKTPKRAFFAYEDADNKITIKSYPIANKIVKELYRCEDKGSDKLDLRFSNTVTNLDVIRYAHHCKAKNTKKNSYYDKLNYTDGGLHGLGNYSHLLTTHGYSEFCYITDTKTDIRTLSLEHAKLLCHYTKPDFWLETQEEYKELYNGHNKRNGRY